MPTLDTTPGQVGNIGVTILDASGAVHVARTTAGITELAAVPGAVLSTYFVAPHATDVLLGYRWDYAGITTTEWVPPLPDNAGIATASAAATSAANDAASAAISATAIHGTDFPALAGAIATTGAQLYAAGAGSVSVGTPITREALIERGTDALLTFDADTSGRTSTLALYPQGNPTAALTVAGMSAGTVTTVSLTDTQTAALNGTYRMVLDSTLGSDTVRHIDGLLVAV